MDFIDVVKVPELRRNILHFFLFCFSF